MTTRIQALLGVMLVASLAVAQTPATPKADGKALEATKPSATLSGTWVVTSATRDGKALPDMESARITIAAKEVTIQSKDGLNLSMPLQVDPTKKPSAIDFQLGGGEGWLNINGPFKGIYELDGDSLKLCIGSNDTRPAKFSDQGAALIMLTRQKLTPIAVFKGHATEVIALSFRADGKQVVSVSPKDVRFWHADSGKEITSKAIPWTDQGGGPVFAIGPDSPDGPTLAMVEWRRHAESKRLEPNVVLISSTGGKELLAFNARGAFDKESSPNINALAFSPDGKHLVTAGSVAIVGGPHGLPGGAVKTWDTKNGKVLRQLGERKKWDQHFQKPLPSGEVLPGVSTSADVSSATYSADGKMIVAGTYGASSELPEAGEVWIWNAADGKLVRVFTAADKVNASGPDYRVSAVALSPDNKRVAAAVAIVPAGGPRRDEHPTEVRVWGIASGDVIHTLRGHKGWVTQVIFSPDGKWLASAGRDKVVRLWRARTGREVIAFAFDTPRINAIAFSADGRLLAAGGGDGKKSGEVRVWACPKD